MANRVLPSRDDAAAMLRGELDEDEGARIVADLLRLAASGDLVDREAIDYEAAQRMLDIIDQLVPPLRTADDARPIVDAALRVTDER